MSMWRKFLAWLKEDTHASSESVHCNICYDVGIDSSGLRCKCFSGSESNG
jgi:hypothetical protein